jgi:TonB family protein
MKQTKTLMFVSMAAAGLLVSSVASAKPKARSHAPKQAQVAAPAAAQVASTTAGKVVARPAAPVAGAVSADVSAAPLDPLEAALARAAAHASAAPATHVPAAPERARALAVLRDETHAASAIELLDRNREQTMPVGETVEHFKVQPLDQKSVAKVIHGNATALQHCHARLTARGKRCDGDTSLRFTIDPRGKVTSVVVHASGADAAALEACIAATVKTWKFPAAAAPTDVDYPLVFDTAR